VIFEPMDFIARLVALVPKPRVNLTRFHGVFAPNSAHRAQVTPAKRGKGNKVGTLHATDDPTPAERRAAMTWAQRLKRVFNINIETCKSCGGAVKIVAPAHPCARDISASVHVIACIEDPLIIKKVLTHLDNKTACGAADSANGLTHSVSDSVHPTNSIVFKRLTFFRGCRQSTT
jgi:hypothetical protein